MQALNFFSSRPALEMKRTVPAIHAMLSLRGRFAHPTTRGNAPSLHDTANVSAARWPTEGTQFISVANESSVHTLPKFSPSMLHIAMVLSSLQVYSTLAGDQQHAVTASLSEGDTTHVSNTAQRRSGTLVAYGGFVGVG